MSVVGTAVSFSLPHRHGRLTIIDKHTTGPLDTPAEPGAGTGSATAPSPSGKAAWRTLLALRPFLAPYRWRIVVAGVSLLVAAAATLAIPVAFRFLIDRGFVAPTAIADGLAANPATDVNGVFVALFAVALLLAAATAIRFYCVSWLGDRMVADLRKAVFASVLRQDPAFFETLRTGEVLSRLSSDTTLIQTLVGSSLSLGLRNALLFLGALALMIWSSPMLASIIVALLVLVVAPILIFGRRVRTLSRSSQDRLADTSARAGETLGAMSTVQSYVREAMESARYDVAVDAAFATAIRRNRSRAALTAIAITLIFGSIVFVLWLGARGVMSGSLSPGLLTQFMLYAALVAGSTGALSEVLGDVQRAAGATERLLELLDIRPTIRAGSRTLPERDTAGARVAFSNVRFAYPSRPDDCALDQLSFVIEPGETVALVGPSGAGKTTVLQLLMRFYDPESGEIRVDGVALPDLTLEALRQSIGFVSQESVVFSEDVAANLRYGRLEASDDELIVAARDAQAHDFIERLPQGYATYLGERGVRLSGGQRQRLSIARALLKNPPLLLLDEATSALDAESERKVQLALERAMHGRTTLVIAHRLATIVGADRILVLDDGRLVQSGSHAELVTRSGLYAKLADMQFGAATEAV